VTVNTPGLVAVPPDVVTAMCPVVAPDGTLTTILVAEFEMIAADVPLKVTRLA
jgi:hypothetical protein